MTLRRTVSTALLTSALAATCGAQTCHGGPTVVFPDGGGTSTCEKVDGRYRITITLTTAAFDVVIIVQANTTHDIKWIQIRTDPSERGALSVYGANPNIPAGPIGSIYQEGDGPVTLVRVLTTGPMGAGIGGSDPAIHVDKFSFLHVQGDVYKRIEVSEGKLLDATIDGDLLGDVIVPNSWIASLQVGGSIGSPSAPVNIWTKNTLNTLICQDLYANIDTTLYGVSAGIFTLRVESANSSRGNFDGSIRTGYVVEPQNNGAFVITGDVLGEINVARDFGEDITIGTFSADEPFFIGEQYELETLTRFTEPLGLQGQMIINGYDLNYDWDGEIEYFKDSSFVALSPVPYYDNLSADLGGGAVGLVPYYLRYQDCDPVGTKVNPASNGLDGIDVCDDIYHAIVYIKPADPVPSVTLRHYGPIEQHGLGRPYTVKRKPLGGISCVWTNVSSSVTHTLPAGDDRAIVIDGAFIVGYDYLIEPRMYGVTEDAYLYCGGLDASVGEVSLYPYEYVLRVVASQDITLNGLLQPDDITAWLADPQDTTQDGVIDGADLVDVIDAVAEYGE